MLTPTIDYIPVNTNNENDKGKLQGFANSFEHEIKTWRYPIYKCVRMETGQYIGYTQVYTAPTIFTAWHPQIVTPREMAEVNNAFRNWCRIAYGDGMLAVPSETSKSQIPRKFTPEIMGKLGYNRMDMELYEPKIIIE